MEFKSILKSLFVVSILMIILLIFNNNKAGFIEASGPETATVDFNIGLNDGNMAIETTGDTHKKDDDYSCFIKFSWAADTPAAVCDIEKVVGVSVTITGSGIDQSIVVNLLPPTPGKSHYTGSQANLPVGVELTFLAEAKDVSEQVIFSGTTKKTLEAGITNAVAMTLSRTCVIDPHLPIVNLSTSNSQIVPGGVATIQVEIGDEDDDEIDYTIENTSLVGILSDTDGSVALVNNRAQMEITLTADASSGDYTDTVIVRVSDPEGGNAIMSIDIEVKGTEVVVDVNLAPNIKSFTIEYIPVDEGADQAIITAGVEDDETDPANLIYLWEGNVTFIGGNDVNPITIEQPAASTVITLTVTDEENAVSGASCYVSPNIL